MSRKIIIVGLGPGDPGHLTAAALNVIGNARTVFLRTAKHPTVPHLPTGPKFEAFDEVYDRGATFSEVYDTIVARLLELAQKDDSEPVIYAVPGHPLVGETSVVRLLTKAEAAGIATEIVAGLSFIEPVCAVLRLDPFGAGLLVLDATELAERVELHLPRSHGFELPVTRPLLIGQVYNQRLAGSVKLALMENYPDEHPVTLLRGAGVPGEEARLDIPLFELDRHPEWTDHLTCVYLPPLEIIEALGTFANAQYVVARLRGPGGCEWDRQQTHSSLKRHLIEETYEVVHALDEDPDHLPEELGDLLLQILLHAQIAADAGEWSMAEVMREMSEKLIRRHPHVFGEAETRPNWEVLKQAEREAKGENTSVLSGVPREMPALQQAQTLQRKAAAIGFEWHDFDEILDKLVEEINEVRHITNHEELVGEIGDVFAVLASAARWLKVDAEEALRITNNKFRRRFEQWEVIVKERQLDPHQMNSSELQAIWMAARRRSGENV